MKGKVKTPALISGCYTSKLSKIITHTIITTLSQISSLLDQMQLKTHSAQRLETGRNQYQASKFPSEIQYTLCTEEWDLKIQVSCFQCAQFPKWVFNT
jgi:hypothetical protein